MSAVRSAEADRLSSCKFADAVATAVINKYKETCSDELRRAYKQTVLAAFVLQVPLGLTSTSRLERSLTTAETEGRAALSLEVVSLGVGTKFLKAEQLIHHENMYRDGTSTSGGIFLKDMHAEVLAKRGFQRFLLQECFVAIKAVRDGTAPSRFLECMNISTMELRFREGITVHLYSSSQPCGNASIKRWAKGKAPTQYPELNEHEYPLETHPTLHLTAVHEGQVALLVKGGVSSGVVGLESKGGDVLTAAHIADIEAKSMKIEHLSGTFPSSLWPLRVGLMSCSDKVAKWNALGCQGSLLSGILSGPVYLTTCVIGRKYSHAHLCRALCCRISGYTYPFNESNSISKRRKRKGSELASDVHSPPSNSASLYYTHHPSLLSTSVKFDDGAIITAPSLCTDANATELSDSAGKAVVGADFGEVRCFVFVRGNEEFRDICDVIDSRSGILFGGEGNSSSFKHSGVSGVALHDLRVQLAHAIGGRVEEGNSVDLSSMPCKSSLYESAKAELFNNVFKDWIR
jgi:double-stranded RNA-specific adenosine deaminase